MNQPEESRRERPVLFPTLGHQTSGWGSLQRGAGHGTRHEVPSGLWLQNSLRRGGWVNGWGVEARQSLKVRPTLRFPGTSLPGSRGQASSGGRKGSRPVSWRQLARTRQGPGLQPGGMVYGALSPECAPSPQPPHPESYPSLKALDRMPLHLEAVLVPRCDMLSWTYGAFCSTPHPALTTFYLGL